MKTKDNPNAFKNFINEKTIGKYAAAIKALRPDFSESEWVQNLKTLNQLELKARAQLISTELHRQLPSNEKRSFDTIEKILQHENWSGFELWPVSEYLGTFGLEHFDRSLHIMTRLTEIFTSEFAVRPFIMKDPNKTYQYLLKMTKSKNVHHRRWASEGSRPRLPWGLKLTCAIQNPKKGLQVLENLKSDQELYVRKSIANHLNDISKDHPDLVIHTLKKWKKDNLEHYQFIKKQALRTLIKKGNPQALELMGFHHQVSVKVLNFKIAKPNIKLNQEIEFSFSIQNPTQKTISVNVDYALYFKKSNGLLSPHVFKLKVVKLKANDKIQIKKRHKIKLITTRKYYSGDQKLALIVNGQSTQAKKWKLAL